MTTKILPVAMFGLLGTVAAMSASAHEAWVQPGPGPIYPIEYGDFTPEAYPTAKVKSAKAFDAERRPLKTAVLPTVYGANLKVSGTPSVIGLHFDNGYYSKKADGSTVNLPKAKVPGAVSTSHPIKYAKTILRWDASAFQPLGQPVEIMIVDDKAPKPHSPATLQVLLNGKPLADAELELVGIIPEGKGPHTDANGRVTVDLEHGIQRLAVQYKLPASAEPEVDSESWTAALLFVID